jgi:S-adenosylmethionine synthetase
MMFGYAIRESDNYMPLPLDLSHKLLFELAKIRKQGKEMTYLRPDSKSQVTIQYSDDGVPERIEAIVISTQHDDGFENSDDLILEKIKKDVIEILIPRVKAQMSDRVQTLFKGDHKLHVNPTGKFVIGGPHGDSGLTGRKIIVDTYGGKGAHGGGAFSGKDPSKVDRSAAYATRHIAKHLVAAGVCDEVLVQVAYAIGVADPVGLYVDTYGTAKLEMLDSEIAQKIEQLFSMKPYDIEQRFNLRTPIYSETSSYGHMGRTPKTITKTFEAFKGGEKVDIVVELFPWEKLDMLDEVKSAFGL